MRSLELRACDGLTPARVTASHQSFLALGDRYCGERECPLLGEQRPREFQCAAPLRRAPSHENRNRCLVHGDRHGEVLARGMWAYR
jgi:hypothetical protein